MMNGNYYGWGMTGMAGVWFVCLALVAGFVWVVVKLGTRQPPEAVSAEAILRRRYAQGEIDRDTYRHLLSELKA